MKKRIEMKGREQEIPCVFRIVVAAIIVKEGRVLLLQRKDDEEIYPGLWELPSGKREFNEMSIEALIREVKEETSLSIVIARPISVFEYLVKTPTEIRDTTQISFLAYPANLQEVVKINKEEHQAAQWFSAEELLSLQNISEETRRCAIMALKKPTLGPYINNRM